MLKVKGQLKVFEFKNWRCGIVYRVWLQMMCGTAYTRVDYT